MNSTLSHWKEAGQFEGKEESFKVIVKKLKVKIGEDRVLTISIPEMSPGEVEVIILKKEKSIHSIDEILSQLPVREVGIITGTLRREEIYNNGR